MDPADLSFSELHRTPEADIAAALERARGAGRPATLDLAMPGCATQSSNLAMSDDWYTALLLGELVAPHCDRIDWEELRDCGSLVGLRFRLAPAAPAGIAERLAWLAQGLHLLAGEDEDGWTATHPNAADVENVYQEWKHELHEEVRVFDDLAANFVAELTVGLTEAYAEDEVEEIYAELRETYRRWWRPELERGSDR
jgi:hypothetical protein